MITKEIKEEFKHNKSLLMFILKNNNIDRVIVNFDGQGDSGQVEDIEFWRENKEVDVDNLLKEPFVGFKRKGKTKDDTIQDVLSQFAYDLLENYHCGWENDEGAFGDVIFDVIDNKILFEYNERFTDYKTYNHEV